MKDGDSAMQFIRMCSAFIEFASNYSQNEPNRYCTYKYVHVTDSNIIHVFTKHSKKFICAVYEILLNIPVL